MINNAIKSFRAKVNYISENPGYKSGEVLEADSAVWYLEATINYSHAFPNDYYGQMKIDTSYITLTRNNEGKVDMNELSLKYDQMKEGVSDAYNNSGFGEKGLVLVDLTEETFKSDEITVKIVAVTGEKNSTTPPGFGIEGPFVEGDDWRYGEFFGKCDNHSIMDDAANQLMVAMNNYIPDPGGNYTFTNLTTVIKKGGNTDLRRPTDPEPKDNNFDYYLFSASEEWGAINDDILCLEYGEMNIYFNYLKYLLLNKIPGEDVPVAYSIESVISLVGSPETVNQNYMHYFHVGSFQFGLKVYYDGDQGPSLID